MGDRAAETDGTEAAGEADEVPVWLVERTYSDDEQNLIILVYATTDGERYLRKERALPSFTTKRATTAGLLVSPDRLGRVDDPDTRAEYAAAAKRTAAQYDRDEEY